MPAVLFFIICQPPVTRAPGSIGPAPDIHAHHLPVVPVLPTVYTFPQASRQRTVDPGIRGRNDLRARCADSHRLPVAEPWRRSPPAPRCSFPAVGSNAGPLHEHRAAAPRDSASSPSAPVPANRSRQRAPWIWCDSQLKRVSRMRSEVGLRPSTSAISKRRLRQFPATIRSRPVWGLALCFRLAIVASP